MLVQPAVDLGRPKARRTSVGAGCPGNERQNVKSSLSKAVTFLGVFFALGFVLWSPLAHAADEEDSAITILIAERVAGSKVQEKIPVAGVKVRVEGAAGSAVGVTDAKGIAVLGVPPVGKYEVSFDVSTLPKGVAVGADSKTSLSIDFSSGVSVGSGKSVSFFVGNDARVAEGRWEQLPQVLVGGIRISLILAICSIGLALIFGTTGLTNFAHSEIITVGAMVAFWFNQNGPQWPLLLAAPFGIVGAALMGGAFELRLWRPLRRRGTSLTSMMIVSIGMAIGIRYVLLFLLGGRNRRYAQYVGDPEIDFGPFGITPRDIAIMVIALIVVVGFSLFLLYARFGKAIRAVSDNPDLASATGINTDRVILLVWILGGALAGLGGVMNGASTGVQWDMGNVILLLLFAAFTIGGLGNPFGALVGSFVIGMFTQLWTWVFPSVVELKALGALIALVVVLLVRPEGILGKKERVG